MNDDLANNITAILVIIAVAALPFIRLLIDHNKELDEFNDTLRKSEMRFRGLQFLKSISVDPKDRNRLGLFRTYGLSNEEREYIYKQLTPELVTVFGDNYREKFDLSKTYRSARYEPQDCLYWAERLFYAKRGLIIDNGIIRVGDDDVLVWNLKMLKIMETHLSKAYPSAGKNTLYYHATNDINVYDPYARENRTQKNKLCANGLFVLGAHNIDTARRVWKNEEIGDPQ